MKRNLRFYWTVLTGIFMLFSTASFAQVTYCASAFTNVTYEHITNVNYAGINNTSAGTIGGPVDYTAQIATVQQGGSDTMRVTIFPDGLEYIYVFIDWNQNGTLNDAGEVYTIASNVNTAGPHVAAISVPAGATLGNTRMRVMLAFNISTPNPCVSSIYGEAEDYTVNVTGGLPPVITCPITTTPVATGGTSCGSSPAVLTATTTGALVLWQNSGGYAVGTGSVFSPPLLPAAASYSAHHAAVNNTLYSPGPSTTITTGGFGNFSNGTYFTAISPFMWDSVTLRSNGAVSGFIRIWDANPTNFPNANLLQSTPFNVGVAGDVQVPVGLSFSPGSYYVNLAFNAGSALLWRSTTTNVGYPFVVPNVVSIDSSWLGAGSNLNRIYYLLDWKIKEMCIGTGDTVVAGSAQGSSTTLPYAENFENGLPCDWSRSQNAGSDGFLWGTSAALSSQFYPIPPHTNFMASNDDDCNCNMSNDRLISPMFDLSTFTSLSSLTLDFDYFLPGNYGSEGFVLISTNGGATFTVIDTIPQQSPSPLPVATVWASHTVDLSAYAGMDSVHFAFQHDDNGFWADGLAIDNVSLVSGCSGEDVTITVVTDIYGSETTWQLKNAVSGAILASGGPYPDVTPYNQAAATHVSTVCVPSGTNVTFRINDSYGDGLFDGTNTGTYNVTIDCGTIDTLFSGSGAFPYGGGTPAPQVSWDSANFVVQCQALTACPITTTPTATGGTSCATSPAVLTATPGSPLSYVIWQDTSGTVVGSGNIFSAPLLATAATYTAHDAAAYDTLYSPGPPTSITPGGFGNFSNGMYFRAISAFSWDSVTFRSNGPASGLIRIWDANPTNFPTANVLQSVPFSVGAAGDIQVPVGLTFTPGSYYVNLAFNVGSGLLWRSTGTAVGYPFAVPNVMSIDSSWLGAGNNLNRVYYFLNWKVSEVCVGTGVAVTAGSSPGSSTALPYSEDFENGLPCDWSRTQNTGSDGFLWGNSAALSSQFYPIPPHTNFMASNDDACNCDMSNDMLISPMFDFTSYTSLSSIDLTFDYFLPGTYGSEGEVLISTDGGATFTSISVIPQQAPTPPLPTVWASHTVDLSPYAGMDSVHFAFKHDDNAAWADGLAIDNVSVVDGCGGEVLTVTVITDIYGSETSWELRDATTGNVYASGGPYTDITPYNQAAATYVSTVCVPTGATVTFRINDSYGDGLFDGVNTGTFDVSMDCGTPYSLFSGGGAFPYGGGTPAPQVSWDSANFVVQCPAVNTVNVTFQVNMSEVTVSANGVHVMGDFNGWSPSATAMTAQGGGIYTYTTALAENTNYEYKFVNGNQTINAEVVQAGCSTNGNRLAAVGSTNLTLPLVCFSECANCDISIEELSLEQSIEVYPNPASGIVSLDFAFNEPKDVQIIVTDPIGKIVFERAQSGVENSIMHLDISTWANGIYFVKVQAGSEYIVRRLVVSN